MVQQLIKDNEARFRVAHRFSMRISANLIRKYLRELENWDHIGKIDLNLGNNDLDVFYSLRDGQTYGDFYAGRNFIGLAKYERRSVMPETIPFEDYHNLASLEIIAENLENALKEITLPERVGIETPAPPGYSKYPFISREYKERFNAFMDIMSVETPTVHTAYEATIPFLGLTLCEYSVESVKARLLPMSPKLIERVRKYVNDESSKKQPIDDEYIQFLRNYDEGRKVFIVPIPVRKPRKW